MSYDEVITYVVNMTYVHITCQAELILLYITVVDIYHMYYI